jgi:hypothetical protein
MTQTTQITSSALLAATAAAEPVARDLGGRHERQPERRGRTLPPVGAGATTRAALRRLTAEELVTAANAILEPSPLRIQPWAGRGSATLAAVVLRSTGTVLRELDREALEELALGSHPGAGVALDQEA